MGTSPTRPARFLTPYVEGYGQLLEDGYHQTETPWLERVGVVSVAYSSGNWLGPLAYRPQRNCCCAQATLATNVETSAEAGW